MPEQYCLQCMQPLPEGGPCPHCAQMPKRTENDLSGKKLNNGKYLVGAMLGRGGFGITYIGRDLDLDIVVAIKEYFPFGIAHRGEDGTVAPEPGLEKQYDSGLKKSKEEAQRVAGINDIPNIVKVYSALEENGTVYIIMDYVSGRNLSKYVEDRGGKLPVRDTAELMNPIFETLKAIHERGIYHRDISPENIMIRDNGKAVLLDFGAAKDVHRAEKTLSMGGTVTLNYSPPEQFATSVVTTPYLDEYAFCATLYFMLTGEPPLSSMQRSIGRDELKKPSELNPEITPALDEVLLKGMSIEAEDRYASIADLEKAMNTAIKVTGGGGHKKRKFGPEAGKDSHREPPKPIAKKKLIWVLAAVLLLGAVLAGVLLLRGDSTNRSSYVADIFLVKYNSSGYFKQDSTTVGQKQLKENECYFPRLSITNTSDRSVKYTASVVLDGEKTIDFKEKTIEAGKNDYFNLDSDECPEVGEHSAVFCINDEPQKEFRWTVIESTQTPTPIPVPSVLVDVGDMVTFGSYPQTAEGDDDTPIEWLVLEVNAGENKALLLSRYCLDAKPYNKDYADVTWEDCTLRAWLNGDFFNHAFSNNEQQLIFTTNVSNDYTQGDDALKRSEPDTEDRIFLLSYMEAKNYLKTETIRFSDSNSIVTACASPTDYAVQNGADVAVVAYSDNEDKENKTVIKFKAATWWLRSPGTRRGGSGLEASYCSSVVNIYGYLGYSNAVTQTDNAVRPALWVRLDPDYITITYNDD